jgi:DUF955
MGTMFDYIKELADVVRKYLNLSDDTCETTKSLEDLIERLGGKITYEKLDRDIEGQIIKGENNTFHIIINKNIQKKEICLKISEELGHLFLHMGFIIDENQWEKTDNYIDSVYYRIGYSKEEYEANYFAKLLLGYQYQEELQQLLQ